MLRHAAHLITVIRQITACEITLELHGPPDDQVLDACYSGLDDHVDKAFTHSRLRLQNGRGEDVTGMPLAAPL